MSARDFTDDRAPANARVRFGGQIDATGVYLTDGAFLDRLTGPIARGPDEIVEIEDCYGLDVGLFR